MPINFKVAIKSTPSISKAQKAVRFLKQKNPDILEVKGRHDPIDCTKSDCCIGDVRLLFVILDELLPTKKYEFVKNFLIKF